MAADGAAISRDSLEYAEILSEVFVETLSKSADRALCCQNGAADITAALMDCLQFLYLQGPSAVSRIADGLEVTLPAASQLVDRLVRKGLVQRRENELDRRLTTVELTDSGRAAAQEVRKRRSDWFRSVLGAMPEKQRSALRDGLEGFLRIALASEERIEQACVRCGMEHVSFCVINRLKAERERTRKD